MNLQIIALSINLLIAVVAGLAALRGPRPAIARLIFSLALFTAIWIWCTWLLKQPADTGSHSALIPVLFISATLAASTQFVYAVSFADRQHWMGRVPLALLAIMPTLTLLLFWVGPWHEALFGPAPGATTMSVFLGGAWGKVAAAYLFSLMGIGSFSLWNAFLERPRLASFPFAAILFGSLLTPLAATLDFAGFDSILHLELLPLGFTLAGLAYLCYLFRPSADQVSSIDRNAVVQGMDDGWMVLDNQNIVVDMNPAAERMAGLARDKLLGQPVSRNLVGLPDVGQSLDRSQELEMKRSIRSEDGWKYLNIRISPLNDKNRQPFGRLALWHDVTDRKLTEDARQRARDEMLVLLNGISSAASTVVDLEDFLSESIYHIIYPFRSQVAAFFLFDEKSGKKETHSFYLSASLGLPAACAKLLSYVSTASPLFSEMVSERQPLQVENVDGDDRVPDGLRGMGLACLLLIPLVTQSGEDAQVLGCMCLARKDLPAYSPDEIVRLSMIADQIGALIDSDRRRKLAITSSERKRVMRDLHDSVSQKLYGLVTTTEAAQAAIEAGSIVDPSEVLARIGENARQAVKEMRLFLFQMQPVDMEKDGLISLLHYRLAAVEGRADIKAQFRADLADDEVALSKQTSVVLYYIAMEALNNVLKHAGAKSVSLTLKQGRRNVILEIVDDGCGFDPKKVERGGLGLINMRERASQIHGKLQIVSRSDKGTRLVITVPRDASVKTVKHRR